MHHDGRGALEARLSSAVAPWESKCGVAVRHIYHSLVHGTRGPSSTSTMGWMHGSSTNISSLASGSRQYSTALPVQLASTSARGAGCRWGRPLRPWSTAVGWVRFDSRPRTFDARALERRPDGVEALDRVGGAAVPAVRRPRGGRVGVGVGQLEVVDLLLAAAQEEAGEGQLERAQVVLVDHPEHPAVEAACALRGGGARRASSLLGCDRIDPE